MLLSLLRSGETGKAKLLALGLDRRGVTAVEVSLLMLLLVPMLVVVVDLFQIEAQKRRMHQLSRAMASNVVANFESPVFELAQRELVDSYFEGGGNPPETRIQVEACYCDDQQRSSGSFCAADEVATQIISVSNRAQASGTWLGNRNINISLKVKRVGNRGC